MIFLTYHENVGECVSLTGLGGGIPFIKDLFRGVSLFAFVSLSCFQKINGCGFAAHLSDGQGSKRRLFVVLFVLLLFLKASFKRDKRDS